MSDTEEVTARLDTWRPLSWSAIIYGAVIALAISTMLNVLGIGITASSVDPSQRPGNFFMTLGGVSGVWLIVATIIGLFVGGFVAATISRTFSDERAVLYGLGVWGVSSLITIAIAAGMTFASVGGAVTAAGNVAQAAGSVVGNTFQALANAAQGVVSGGFQLSQNLNLPQNLPDNILRRIEQTLTGGQRGQINPQGAQQILAILQQAIQQGNLTDQQVQRLETAVATTFNISPEEARQRARAVASQVNETLANVTDAAREAAEAALNALAVAAYWSFAAILLGGIAALIGARYGALDPEDLPRFVRTRLGGAEYGRGSRL